MKPHQALLAALVVALLSVSFGSCRFVDGRRVPDWPAIQRELELGAADLRDAALLLEDAPTADALRDLASILETTAESLAEAGAPADLLDALDLALGLADDLIDRLPDQARQRALAAILVARAGLRRARAYAVTEP